LREFSSDAATMVRPNQPTPATGFATVGIVYHAQAPISLQELMLERATQHSRV
jgi:hypothetical protein